ncbi:MAG TPA: hypothetical protein VJ208_00445 [Candidatus Nanoarchaeia archaeon]|nr:hypothetical protein [Candidatus Nanoarchaeia archaeon]
MERCPTDEIKISENREIVNTDNLHFLWHADSNGYFLVKIKDGEIHCGFVNNNREMVVEFVGKKPEKIIKEIAKRNLCDLEHMGYIASELSIAHDCLKNNKNYVQR